MEKRVMLGVQRGRPIKRNNKKFLKKVVDYFKSDSYLFAPLVSLKIYHSSTAGLFVSFVLLFFLFPHFGTLVAQFVFVGLFYFIYLLMGFNFWVVIVFLAVKFKEPSYKRRLKKFVEYLKSDTYMYASLVGPPLLVRKTQKAGNVPFYQLVHFQFD